MQMRLWKTPWRSTVWKWKNKRDWANNSFELSRMKATTSRKSANRLKQICWHNFKNKKQNKDKNLIIKFVNNETNSNLKSCNFLKCQATNQTKHLNKLKTSLKTWEMKTKTYFLWKNKKRLNCIKWKSNYRSKTINFSKNKNNSIPKTKWYKITKMKLIV